MKSAHPFHKTLGKKNNLFNVGKEEIKEILFCWCGKTLLQQRRRRRRRRRIRRRRRRRRRSSRHSSKIWSSDSTAITIMAKELPVLQNFG
jgi:hypothetical protein